MAGHLIHRVRVELRTANREVGDAALEAGSRFAREELPAQLENFLDRHFPHGTHRRMESLEIDLGVVSSAHLQQAMARALAHVLRTTTPSDTTLTPGDRRATPGSARSDPRLIAPYPGVDDNALPAFVGYLETGTRPWWMTASRWRTAIPAELIQPGNLASTRTSLAATVRVLPDRVLRLLPFAQLIDALFEDPALSPANFAALAEEHDRTRMRAALWLLTITAQHGGVAANETAVLRAVRGLLGKDGRPALSADQHDTVLNLLAASHAPTDLRTTSILSRLVTAAADRATLPEASSRKPRLLSSEPRDPSQSKAPARAEERANARSDEAHATESAGIVLVSPFLIPLFRDLGWLDARNRLLHSRRWHGVQTLHWLTHARLATDETDVVLERVICGLELSEPGELPDLAPAVLGEVDALLRAVIGHWSAIRNTTVDGLRESFLARPGLLTLTDRPFLRVESRAYDMLLDRLPWSFTPVVLPWMRLPLHVQWTTP